MAEVQGTYNGQPLSLSVSLTDKNAQFTNGKYYAILLVHAKARGNRNVPNVPILVFRDGDEYEPAVAKRTDANGLFNTPIQLPPENGRYVIEVMVAGTSTMAGEWVTVAVAEKERRIPVEIGASADPQGNARRYYISGGVFASDKLGVGIWPIEVRDLGHPDISKRMRKFNTDQDGNFNFTVDATDPREIKLWPRGIRCDPAILRLPGPTRRDLLPPPQVPQHAPQAVRQQGFLAVLKWYHNRATKELAKRRR